MRKLSNMLLTCAAVPFFAYGQLTGTVTVGPAGDHPNLSSAFAAINANGVSGTLTLSILGDFTEPDTVALIRSDLSALNNVLIVPASSTTPAITVQSLNGLSITGASYVTIDGSNSGGTSRDLNIVRSASSAGSSIMRVQGTVNPLTIKNCVLGDATNTPDYVIRIDGTSVSNVTIQNNEIHGIGNSNGIVFFNTVGGTNLVVENIIFGDQSGSSKAFGIYLAGGIGTMTVSNNRLHTLKTSGSGGIFGIKESMPAGTLRIENNFVGGNFISTSGSDYFLLDFRGASAKQVYHNTLVLNSIIGTPFDAANLYIQDGTADFRNNIAVNTFNDIFSYVMFNNLSVAGDLTTNYNNLYAPGSNNAVGYDGINAPYDQLSDWQGWTGVTPDLNSVSVAVSFVNSTSDFHLSGGSNGDTQLRGTSGLLSVDIDGDARLTNPDGPYMGADEGSVSLPVQLLSFEAGANGLSAELIWRTASEIDNFGFDIERRQIGAGTDWSVVGFVPAAAPSNGTKEYTFSDNPGTPGRYAYRIRQIDRSGASMYYGAVEVEVGMAVAEFRLKENYPNPFNPSTIILFSVQAKGAATLRAYNLLGQVIATLFEGDAEPGRVYQVLFDGSELPSGLYIARLESGGQAQHLRMILSK